MENPDMQRLGQRVAGARKARGLNQSTCAKEAGMHRPTLAMIEMGEKPHLRSDTLYTLAKVLQVSADYLLGLTDDPRPHPRRRRPKPADADKEDLAYASHAE